MQVPRTSAAAVASLISALVFCVPVVHSLAAIVCGFVGIGATKNPMVRGRGMAVAGLILGIVGLLIWIGVGVGAVYGMRMQQKLAPARTLATTFIQDAASGKLKEAKALVEPGTDTKSLQPFAASVQAVGPTSQILAIGVPNVNNTSGGIQKTVTVVTVAMQPINGRQRQAVIEIVDHPDGTQGIVHWQLNP